MLVTAPDGSIVNDPVLLHIEKDKWWMQLADSDAGPLRPRGRSPTRGSTPR